MSGLGDKTLHLPWLFKDRVFCNNLVENFCHNLTRQKSHHLY